MELGLQIPDFTWPNGPTALGADLARIVGAADQAGFGSIAVMDHFFQIPGVGPTEDDMLEAYTTLGFIAAHTEQARLLTVVTGVLYRHPGLLAKAVTTLDVLSGGRAILGIGAGWNEEESKGLGFPFPSTSERFELLEENLQYVLQMWADGDAPFKSKHFDAGRLLNVPQVLSKPRPPIMIGGGGEKKTLRLVAKYADQCNLFNGPELERKLDVLKEHCRAEGRDYDEITKTVYHILDIGQAGEKSDALLSELERLHGLGFDVALGMVPNVHNPAVLAKFATDVIPAARQIG